MIDRQLIAVSQGRASRRHKNRLGNRPTFRAGLALALALTNSAFAQQPSTRPYETEEDLWEALQEDEITFEEFLELTETYRVGTDGQIVPESDWEELPGADAGSLQPPDSNYTLTLYTAPAKSLGLPFRWSLRSGYDAELDPSGDGDGYTVARFENKHIRGLLDWEHNGVNGRWRRRTFVWNGPGVKAQLGNVEPRWGRGLVIGRRSRVITSSELAGTLAQPIRSRFNGLWIVSDNKRPVSADLLLSEIRSDNLADRVAAVNVTAGNRDVRAGISALNGEIERRDTSLTQTFRIAGGYLRLGRTQREILGEIAVDENGNTGKAAEAVLRNQGTTVHARAWHYSERFINPWGGGPGHSDTRVVTLEDIDEDYSSRTIGERGFHLSTKVRTSQRTTAQWEWMSHRESSSDPLANSWAVRLRWNIRQLSLTPFARGRSEEDAPDTYAFGSYADWGDDRRSLNARIEFGRHHTDADRYVRAGLGLRWQLNRHVVLHPRLRWVDPDLDQPADGYWYFYFTEIVLPNTGSRLEAALVWQRYEDRERGDRVELRVRSILAGRPTG